MNIAPNESSDIFKGGTYAIGGIRVLPSDYLSPFRVYVAPIISQAS